MGLPILWSVAMTAAQASDIEREPPPPTEIVVTGERQVRTIRKTSSSVVVTSQKEIEASGVDRVDQVLATIPNVQLGNGSRGPAIRGLDTTGPLQALPAFLGGNRPRTTIVVDGRPVTYNEFVFGTIPVWDVNRVEVFRSPQTTTQGPNSIAGAIFVETNVPSGAPEYRARAIVGDLHLRQFSALASGPIGDNLGFRVSGDVRYGRTSSRIADVQAGADPNHDVFGVLRAKLVATPLPDTELRLAYTHSQTQAPQNVGVRAPFEERQDKSPGYGIFRINVDTVTASVRQELGERATADVMATYGRSNARRFAVPQFGEAINKGQDRAAEAVVRWRPGSGLSGTVGFAHQHVHLRQFIDLRLLSGSVGRFEDWQDGFGLFAEAEFAPTAKAVITAGARYQHDRQRRRGALTADSFVVPVDYTGKFDAWLPKLSFAYDITPALRAGALVQKAYNPGGTTIRLDTSRPDDFKAETLWDYELFVRSSFAGNRGFFSGNLFYYDISDAQRSETILVRVPSGREVGFANLFNVRKARSLGAEGQLSWQPFASVQASVSAGLLRTKVVRGGEEAPALRGKQFDRSPHFTAAARLAWSATQRLGLHVQARHHSAYYSDPGNAPDRRISSATTVDARAEYRFDRYRIFAQVTNLFDAFNLVDLDTASSGEAEGPRAFGVGLDARF